MTARFLPTGPIPSIHGRMTDPQIEAATVADADELTRVYHDAYRENRELGFPAKAESVAQSEVATWIRENHVFVARVDDAVVGGVRLEETAPDRLKLSRLAVHGRWKGVGIGSRLLDRAERAARDLGYQELWLTTPEDHPYLPALYRRRGYEQTGPYPLEYREYDEIVMEKRLR